MKAITGFTAHQICVFAITDSFNSLPSCEPYCKCNGILEVGYGTTIDRHSFQFCFSNNYCLSKLSESPSTVTNTKVC